MRWLARITSLTACAVTLSWLLWPTAAVTQQATSTCSAPILCPLAGGCAMTRPFSKRATTHPTAGDQRKHDGVDLAANRSDPVRAAEAGQVKKIGRDFRTAANGKPIGYGHYVVLEHGPQGGPSRTTLYAHLLESPRLLVGEVVTKGQIIGLANSSGGSTGDHLHLEYTMGGEKIDPLTCLEDPAAAGFSEFLGTYQLTYTERVITGAQYCDPENFEKEVTLVQSSPGQFRLLIEGGYSVTLGAAAAGGLVGSGSASYPDDGGTTKTSVFVRVSSPSTLSGTAVWNWRSEGQGACSGDGAFVGVKL